MSAAKYLGLALAASFALASPAQAQVQGLGILALDPVADGNTVLAVTGVGKVTAAPDTATYMIGVNTAAETASEAMRNNAATMQKIIAALKKSGVAEKDIQTSNIAITPIMTDTYDYYGTGDAAIATPALLAAMKAAMEAMSNPEEQRIAPPIIGYRATNQVTVKQRELSDYGATVDQLIAAGANQIVGPTFSIAEPQALNDDATAKAVADAQRRAQIYADASDMRIVRVIMFEEKARSGQYGDNIAYEAAYATDGGFSVPTQKGEIDINSTVNVLYELTRK